MDFWIASVFSSGTSRYSVTCNVGQVPETLAQQLVTIPATTASIGQILKEVDASYFWPRRLEMGFSIQVPRDRYSIKTFCSIKYIDLKLSPCLSAMKASLNYITVFAHTVSSSVCSTATAWADKTDLK